VLYHNDNLEYLTEYYLTHEDEREEIAMKGRDCVLSNHTYEHRIKQMLSRIEKFISDGMYVRRQKRNESIYFAKIWFLQSRFGKDFRTR